MAKIRVHELAKELELSSKEMVDILQKLGLDIKNHMSTMEESQTDWVKRQLKKSSGSQQKPGSSESDANKNQKLRSADKPGKSHQPERGSRKSDASRVPTPGPGKGNLSRTPRHSSDGGGRPGSPRTSTPRPGGDRPDTSRTSTPRPGGSRPDTPRTSTPRPGGSRSDTPRTSTPRPGGGRSDTPRTSAPRPGGGRSDTSRTSTSRPGGSQPSGSRTPSYDRKPNQSSRPASGGRPVDSTDKGGKPHRQEKPGKSRSGVADKGKKSTQHHEVRRDYSRPQRKTRHKRKKEETVVQIPELISLEDKVMVRELAEELCKTPAEVLKKLMELGIMASINQVIDFETAEIVANLFDVKVNRSVSEEEKMLEEIVDDEASLKLRPPIVTVMGHVDHGKTSLLDRIRKADVASGEAGGITQHIGAYQVTVNDNRITFIDTPGHEAFTAMRARGANLTDIVILVVAADDGVMPQTIEAVNHIKAAKVPFVVAINKIDKSEANPERVMQQLTEFGIVAEEWGGDTIFVPVSAKTGQGIDTLLEMILLVAEMNEIKANPDRPAEGVVLEGELDKGRGAVATVLILKGTLNVGDYVICGSNMCKIRAMTDYRGRRVEKAYPSMPVEIMGWSDVPDAGGKVRVCDEKVAKGVVNLRINEKKLEEQKQSSRVSLDEFFKQMQDAEVRELNLIIKGDVQGSIEALAQSLLRLGTDEVKVNVIHSGVGAVTETDVMLASASNAIIIGFNVRPDSNARKYAEEENIDVRLYRVIYEAIEDVKKAMAGLLDPEYKEKYLGRAEVRAIFKVPGVGVIGGSYVIDGKIQRNAKVRVLRDGVIIYEGVLSSLKRFKDDAREVLENFECGIGIKDFNDVKEGDTLEAYILEEIPREL